MRLSKFVWFMWHYKIIWKNVPLLFVSHVHFGVEENYQHPTYVFKWFFVLNFYKLYITNIFILNFIEDLICQENNTENIINYLMKILDESNCINNIGSNNANNYFSCLIKENYLAKNWILTFLIFLCPIFVYSTILFLIEFFIFAKRF